LPLSVRVSPTSRSVYDHCDAGSHARSEILSFLQVQAVVCRDELVGLERLVNFMAIPLIAPSASGDRDACSIR
jgi:hypothetical protein